MTDTTLNIREYGMLVEISLGLRVRLSDASEEEQQLAQQLLDNGYCTTDIWDNLVLTESAQQWLAEHRGKIEYHFDEDEDDEYVVPVPSWLTAELKPTEPIGDRAVIDFDNKGKEPYVGYAIEFACWERGWMYMNEVETYALTTIDTPTYMPEPLEYYVACAKYSHDKECEAIDKQMAEKLGVTVESLSTLSNEQYFKLFWEIADERDKVRDPVYALEDSPWTYAKLLANGYVEEIDGGFRFLKRTRDMGLIRSDGPYLDVMERVAHEHEEYARKQAAQQNLDQ